MKTRLLTILLIACSLLTVSAVTTTCQGIQVFDEGTQTCLDSKFECKNYISSNGQNCVAKCGDDEKVFEYKFNAASADSFRQCYSCTSAPNNYLSIDIKSLKPSCVAECQSFEIADNTDKICRPCNKLIIQNNSGLICGDCGQQFSQKRAFDYKYFCTDFCQFDYIKVLDTKQCIRKADCNTFVQNLSCVSECPGQNIFYQDKVDGVSYIECTTTCSYYKFLKDGKQFCMKNCPTGYLINLNRECIPIEQCKDKISSDGLYCTQSCGDKEQAETKDNLSRCVSCTTKYFIEEPAQCVDTCPQDQIPDNNGYCMNIQDCQAFSSDNTICTNGECIYPDILVEEKCVNPCKGKENCIPQCPEGYYQIPSKNGFQCTKFCNQFLSSDDKQCIQSCSVFHNPESGKRSLKACSGCNSSEFPFLANGQYTCTPLYSLKFKDILTNYELRLANVYYYFQFLKIKQELQILYGQLIQSFQNPSDVNEGIKTILKLSTLLQKSQTGSLVGSSHNIEIKELGFKVHAELINKRQYTLKQNYDATDFLSNSNSQLISYKENYDRKTDLLTNAIALIINNPYCTNCSYSKLFQIGSDIVASSDVPTNTIKFAIDDSVKNINQLVCVSYNVSGQMSGSVQLTKISDDKKSVTCTFSNNSALYLDTACKFVDKTNCSSSNSNNGSNEVDASNSNHLSVQLLTFALSFLIFVY